MIENQKVGNTESSQIVNFNNSKTWKLEWYKFRKLES